MHQATQKKHLLTTLFSIIIFGLLTVTILLGAQSADAYPNRNNLLINPGFEDDGVGTSNPTGWTSTGIPNASFTESGGHSGSFRLSFYSALPYTVETVQTVTGLSDGAYTLNVYAKSSGGQVEAYIALRDCGGDEQRVDIPATSATDYQLFTVSAAVSGGSCTVVMSTIANAENWMNFDDLSLTSDSAPTPVPTATATPIPLPEKSAPLPLRGADVSSLHKGEAFGAVYRDANGTEGDALAIMGDYGLNMIRVRVWLDPESGFHTKEHILPMVKRAHDLGIQVLVDFHYSDYWADPGRQDAPSAWTGYTPAQVEQAVYDHTRDICDALIAQGTPPEMVQVGNEINNGMVWPYGRILNNDFGPLATLLKSGIQAMADCSPETEIMLHLAEGGDLGRLSHWYDNVIAQGVQFDVIGVSYYPYYSSHGTIDELEHTLTTLANTYTQDIVIAEFAYPFTLDENDTHENIVTSESQLTDGYPATFNAQQSITRRIMNIVSDLPNEKGRGFIWWDGTWTAVDGNGWDPTDPESGNPWENQALFDFNSQPVPAMVEFAAPADAQILPGDYEVDEGETFTATIAGVDLTEMGALTFSVSFDPAVVTATGCQAAPDGAFSVKACNLDGDSTVRFSMTESPAISGDFTLGTITFTTIGDGGSASDLSVEIQTNDAPIEAVNGSVTVKQRVLGDVSCDGVADVVDVLYIVEYEVNARTGVSADCPLPAGDDTLYLPTCDVNDDAACDAIDGRIILECVVGFSNALCPSGAIENSPAMTTTRDMADAVISAESLSLAVDQSGTMRLLADATQPFSAFTIDLAYDPAVIDATACAGNSAILSIFDCNVDYAAGVVRVAGAITNGTSGDGIELGTIEFLAVGSADQTSPLQLTTQTFNHGSTPVPHATEAGTATITAVPTAVSLNTVGTESGQLPVIVLLVAMLMVAGWIVGKVSEKNG